MGIEEYIHGKVSSVKNERTGKSDLAPEEARDATKAIRRTSFENENSRRGDKHSAEMNVQEQIRAGFGKESKSFKDLYKGFSEDIANLRIRKAKYDSLKMKNNPENVSLLQWTGKDILEKSDDIESQIALQIEVISDPYEKSDLDSLRLELEKITRNVAGLSEKKAVNE